MKLYYETALGKLYHGDVDDLPSVVADESVDLIYTDPPYPREFISTYYSLANVSPQLLKVGGSLITILPHSTLSEIIPVISQKLKWRWLLHMNQWEGSHPRMSMGIEVTFKPMGWWVKEKFPKTRWGGFLRDGIKIEGKSGQKKALHKWEQDLDWCWYVQKLTQEAELVLDPFVGSGTVPIACEAWNRKWIACDVDEQACATTVERLENFHKA